MRSFVAMFLCSISACWSASWAAESPPCNTSSANAKVKSIGLVGCVQGWKTGTHADDSYGSYLKVQNGRMGFGDYYSQLRVVPQISAGLDRCRDVKFWSNFAGVKRVDVLSVQAAFFLQGSSGNVALPGPENNQLLVVGRNKDGVAGCTIWQTSDIASPYWRNENERARDVAGNYTVRLSVLRNESLSIAAVSRLRNAFTLLNVAYNWTDFSGQKVAALENAASEVEKAISGATAVSNTPKLEIKGQPYPQRAFLTTTSELLHPSAGGVVVYVRLSASLLYKSKGGNVSANNILSSTELYTRPCVAEALAGNPKMECKLKREPLRKALREYVHEQRNLKDKPKAARIIASGDKDLTTTCEYIRNWIDEVMQLSTMDSVLVRWAVLSDAGLVSDLNDIKKADALGAKQVPTVSGVELQKACWSSDSKRKFEEFVSAMELSGGS